MNVNPQIGGVFSVRDKLHDSITAAAERAGSGAAGVAGMVQRGASELTTGMGQGLGSGAAAAISGAAVLGRMAIPLHPSSEIIKPMGKYNTFYKIIILVLFFTIFLKVIINIFSFFGIDIIDVYSYMGWMIFLLLILIFIPHDYSTLKLN
jgi:hypothetical protein